MPLSIRLRRPLYDAGPVSSIHGLHVGTWETPAQGREQPAVMPAGWETQIRLLTLDRMVITNGSLDFLVPSDTTAFEVAVNAQPIPSVQ